MTGLAAAIVLMLIAGLVPGYPGWGLMALALLVAGLGVWRERQDYKNRRGGWR